MFNLVRDIRKGSNASVMGQGEWWEKILKKLIFFKKGQFKTDFLRALDVFLKQETPLSQRGKPIIFLK